MINRIIICSVLLAMAYAVCGCEEEPEYQSPFGVDLIHEQEVEIIEPTKHTVEYDGTWTLFKCDGELFKTLVGDGNISGNCLLCGDWVQTSGEEYNHKVQEIISEPNTVSFQEFMGWE